MTIETERLMLAPISNDDMVSLMRNEPSNEMKEAYREMLAGCLAHPRERIWYAVWLMKRKEDGVVVGDFCFKGLGADGSVEIGYGLRDGFCGNGYMTEAVRAAVEWALGQNGVTQVEAEAEESNRASQNVLSRVGFVPTGENGEEGPRFVLQKKA